MVLIKTYGAPPVCKKEILRYAGCKCDTDLPAGMLDMCIKETLPGLTYKVCYSVFDVKITGYQFDFGEIKVKSQDLAKNLKGAQKAVVFAATVGVGIDRLISKYSAISPAKAVILQAIGAERIEALCDMFCEDIKDEHKTALKPRFSPGYGDFDLAYQRDIFMLLNCEKYLGLTLNESMLMSPSKSVTAIVGLGGFIEDKEVKKCDMCDRKECLYRGNL